MSPISTASPPPARGPQDIDYVMCTHLHHDHVGWNTKLRDGTWVPTFPNARYVISKPDFEYYRKLDADPDKAEPVEFGTFRECVLPIVEGRARRPRHRAAPARRTSGHYPGARALGRPRRIPA